MLSKELQVVLDAIQERQRSMLAWQIDADKMRSQEQSYRDAALKGESEVRRLEAEIDALQLDMRRILNGEKSEIPIAPVAQGEVDQVGREG